MKRLLAVGAAMLLAVLLAVPALAYTLPDTTTEDGNTVLELFAISKGTPEQKAYIEEWKNSSHNFLLLMEAPSGGACYYFAIVPEDATVSIVDRFGDTFWFICDKAYRYMGFQPADESGERFPMQLTTSAPGVMVAMDAFVAKTHPMALPTLSHDYIARLDGTLMLKFDDDEEQGGNWWDGLLDWLKNFWDKLLAFFISIFVPEEGYFSEWFETIRAALDKKVGGLTKVMDAISGGFDSLQKPGSTGGVSLKLPDNLYYDGYKGAEFNLLEFINPALVHVRSWLNAVVVIFTCIFCFKKLIRLVNT